MSGKILTIADDSDPLLKQVSSEIDIENELKSGSLSEFIDDMIATMYSASGIGLAAPQVRVLKRIIVFYLPEQRDDVNHVGVPLTVLVNPEMEVLDPQTISDFEGCLSIPGFRGKVPRARKIKYSGYDRNGTFFEREAEGWHARLFQHEFDHLNGILYPELMVEEDSLLTTEQFQLMKQQELIIN